jgi:hypothetical protein
VFACVGSDGHKLHDRAGGLPQIRKWPSAFLHQLLGPTSAKENVKVIQLQDHLKCSTVGIFS